MIRRTLVLAGVIAIIVCALLVNLYILDWVKFPELSEDLRKILALIGVSTVAGLLIVGLIKILQEK